MTQVTIRIVSRRTLWPWSITQASGMATIATGAPAARPCTRLISKSESFRSSFAASCNGANTVRMSAPPNRINVRKRMARHAVSLRAGVAMCRAGGYGWGARGGGRGGGGRRQRSARSSGDGSETCVCGRAAGGQSAPAPRWRRPGWARSSRGGQRRGGPHARNPAPPRFPPSGRAPPPDSCPPGPARDPSRNPALSGRICASSSPCWTRQQGDTRAACLHRPWQHQGPGMVSPAKGRFQAASWCQGRDAATAWAHHAPLRVNLLPRGERKPAWSAAIASGPAALP